MISYHVVQAPTMEELIAEVNKWLDNHWRPIGGPTLLIEGEVEGTAVRAYGQAIWRES